MSLQAGKIQAGVERCPMMARATTKPGRTAAGYVLAINSRLSR